MDQLKTFVSTVSNVPPGGISQLFHSTSTAIRDQDFPEKVVEEVLKHATPVLVQKYFMRPQYERLVIEFLLSVEEKFPGLALFVFSRTLNKLFGNSGNSPLKANKATLSSWITLIELSKNFEKLDATQFKCVAKAYSDCAFLIFAPTSGKAWIHHKALKKFRRLMIRDAKMADQLLHVLLNSDDSTLKHLCVASLICGQMNEICHQKTVDIFVPQIVDFYVKKALCTKDEINSEILAMCGPIFSLVNRQLLNDTLYPAVQKAMLRNAECVLKAVAYLLAQMNVDLDTYAMELCKLIASHLYSKNPDLQSHASEAIKSLAGRCSDANTVTSLAKYLFGVLNGSEGKLNNAAQRIGVLNGIGNLSFHCVNEIKTVDQVGNVVCDEMVALLKQEVHEATLLIALKTLALWTGKYKDDFSNTLTTLFKGCLDMKSSTPSVRYAYLKLMNSSYKGDNLAMAEPLVSILLGVVEKAHKQPTQIQTVFEALPASVLLLKLCAVLNIDTAVKSFWTWISNRRLFNNEKMLELLDEEGYLLMVELLQKLVYENAYKLAESCAENYYDLLILLLNNAKYYSVRRSATLLAKKLLSTVNGDHICKILIGRFEKFLKSSVEHSRAASVTMHAVECNGSSKESIKYFDPKLASESLLVVSEVPEIGQSESAFEICRRTLFLFCCVLLEPYGGRNWFKLLDFYSIDSIDFLTKSTPVVIDEIFACDDAQTAANCTRLLSSIGYEKFFLEMLAKCSFSLNPNVLNEIDLQEVLIFRAPEGVLFDKSVLEVSREQVQTSNIKRESKMYSYKEQMAAIALQKEIEEKLRKEGKLKEELTPKQKEIMQLQIDKESKIRSRISEIWIYCEKALLNLSSLINGNRSLARKYTFDIYSRLLLVLKSPLVAPAVVKQCLPRLRDACFDASDIYTANALLYATLRLEKAACELDKNWCEEEGIHQATRAFNNLYAKASAKNVRKSSSASDASSGSPSNFVSHERASALSGFVFAFSFPLIKHLLLEQRTSVDTLDRDFLPKLVDFCTLHVTLHDVNVQDEAIHAIPFAALLELMFKVVGTTNVGPLQQSACKCIFETTRAIERVPNRSPDQLMLDCSQIVLNNLLQPGSLVRECALKSMAILFPWIQSTAALKHEALYKDFVKRLWVARFDSEENNEFLASKIWDDGGFAMKAGDSFDSSILDDITNPAECIREAASEAVAKFLEQHLNDQSANGKRKCDQILPIVLGKLSTLYLDNLQMIEPVFDAFGRLVREGGVDKWEARAGVATTLRKICPRLSGDLLTIYFDIILPDGINDRSAAVSHLMLMAAVEGVKIHGKEEISRLQPMLEKQLDEMPNDKKHDTLRHSVVVLLGTLAQHLNKDDPKVKSVVAKLIEALSTPSQLVQEAVANCLSPLVPAIKDQVPQLVEKLMCLLLESSQYGEKRGAAFGLAGMVKGMGILSLRQLDIMNKLTEAITDKKLARHREGALLGLEMLCNMLGKLFEPYVVHILPNLLICFGDQDQHVREAADECTKAVMRNLSIHGVKLVLPALLTALEEDSWRTKCGSVELLGAMAYCAPKQLSSCLPTIVPKLIEVLSDTHIKVQKAGSHALRHIGQVIKNPEIQAIVDVLLSAIEDPSRKTASCLQILLNTKFVHYIDAPSLALIMPVVHRALEDRSTETRRSAARIVGSIYSLTDQKDVEPYLPQIMPGLKKCLLDPVPEVRAVASKAIGAMVAATGEADFQDLVPWLKQILASANSSVDRAGGAQGLSELIGGLGMPELNRVMPEIIRTAEKADTEPHVRDGYILMYTYLPTVFGDKFLPYLPKIIPSILTALADENEYVRETALKAGQRLINMYCENALPLLLPSLQLGLFDDNWRIRYSSVQLLGDLLYKISGVTGKMSTESAEDETFGTESLNRAVLDALGNQTRNKVLSGLYICRSDVALLVRQSANHVWKVIVSNTPKTIKEILPTLFQLLLGCLASSSYDKQQVGARALGELVKKLGERILVDVVPVLEQGLKSDQADQRQGVCIALAEIMSNTSKDTILMYAGNLLPSIRMALCDPLPEVRSAAASTFGVLHSTIGLEAMSQVLTPLLAQLEDPNIGSYVLDGLKQVMSVKSRVVLPYMVPKLITPPVNTKALAHLAAVAGDSLNKHLNKILPALVTCLAQSLRSISRKQELENCNLVLDSIVDEQGVQVVLEILLQRSYETKEIQLACAMLLAEFLQHAKVPLEDFLSQIIRGSMAFYASDEGEIVEFAKEALNAVVKSLDSKGQIEHLPDFRQSIQSLAISLKNSKGDQALLPGFSNDKSIQSVLIVLREGVLNGPSESKEYAANGLSELLAMTDPVALKPHVVNVTGPLIRILGDRYPPNVKSAILAALALLLEKVGIMLKPFLPQLQSTFLKTLNEPASKLVRNKAALALSKLMHIHPKPDLVLNDICKNAKTVQDEALRETYLTALRMCLPACLDKINDEVKLGVDAVAKLHSADPDETVRMAAKSILDFLSSLK